MSANTDADLSKNRDLGVPQAPAWYPAWAKELADLYLAGSTSFFVLHGNVHDFVYSPESGGAFCTLGEFLAQQVFGAWELVLSYDLGRGLRAEAGTDAPRLHEMLKRAAVHFGNPAAWPRDVDGVLGAIDRLMSRILLDESSDDRQRLAVILPQAQFLVPVETQGVMGRSEASQLVRMITWAQNPYIKRVNIAVCLLAERLSEVNQRLVQNPHVATIEIPLPDDKLRETYIKSQLGDSAENLGGLSVDGLTQLSAGLNLVNLNVALSRSADGSRRLDVPRFRKLKKAMIERQCRGLVSFVEPDHKLDMLVGQQAAKERLELDAKWIGEGRLDAAPMGYLICGPVGTGKTYLAECYAGSIGIPCLVLRNFRSKFVGETEGNLEQVLNVLRSLGPVVVIVDEADAALGNRSMDGDSGTSNRVFSMIASQMGDTRYRGRIVWMLLTSRPDMLPIDLKRQGRAEVHIPLFYPQEKDEIAEMLRVMAAKNRVTLATDALPPIEPERQLSGADLESVVLGARRRALAANRETVDRGDMEAALHSFIPSAQGLEKEIQELVAVIECTEREFLPDTWREKIDEPNGRLKLQQKLSALRQLVD